VPAATRSFSADPMSVTDARHLVEAMLHGCPEHVASDAILLTSELVSNAVLHARTPFEVEVQVEGTVRIVVRDGSSATPVVRHPAPDQLGGRGLLLVDTLADRWGFEVDATGKTVWFEIDP
jgi:anti-sigma regulatory factor (Ser/Thr protein kinase)